MQIHELTKRRRTDEGLLDTMRDGINAIKTGYKQGGDTLGQKLKGAAKASVSPQALAQAERERSNREKDKVIAQLNKQINTPAAPNQPATQAQPNVTAAPAPVTSPASSARVQPGTILTTTGPGNIEYFKTPNGAWFEKQDPRPGIFAATGAMQIKDPVKTATLEKIAAKRSQVAYVKPDPDYPHNFVTDVAAQRRASKMAWEHPDKE